MWNRSPIIRTLSTLLLFLFLEGVSLVLVSNHTLFQGIKATGFLMQVKGTISGTISNIRYYNNLTNVNKSLQQENLMLRQQIEKLRSQVEDHPTIEDHTSVRKYFSITDTTSEKDYTPTSTDTNSVSFSYIPAKVLSNSTNKMQNHMILDKGYKDGIEKDMGVISPVGVVGVVRNVSANFCYVSSFLNTGQSVNAMHLPSGAFGPLRWSGIGRETALLSEIPLHIAINVGDTVATSGYSSLFPPGIPLGTAISSSMVGGASKEIEIRLFEDFKTLRFVNIVKNDNIQELQELTGDDRQL
jgi:rod shape-determining protein MreC